MYTEDGYIIDKCLNGDAGAFGLLVDKYKACIYALASSKLGNFHNASDITQEVFIRAYTKLRTLKRWDKVLAWLYSITSNLCKDFWRKKSIRPVCESVVEMEKETVTALSINAYRDQLMLEMFLGTKIQSVSSTPHLPQVASVTSCIVLNF